MANFHLPLSEELHHALREESQRQGTPATKLARQALRAWLEQQARRRRSEAIRAYAEANAGTEFDLDEDLEAAGLEVLNALD